MAEGTPDDRARGALPALDDLWGAGWSVDADEDDAGDEGGVALPVACLPASFPDDRLAGAADTTFLNDHVGALVHAVALAFEAPDAAGEAFAVLGGLLFVECFAAEIGATAVPVGPGEVLAPVVTEVPFGLAVHDVRLAVARAAFSYADAEGLQPIVLDVATVAAGAVVVLLSLVSPGDHASSAGWRALVAAVSRRLAAAH